MSSLQTQTRQQTPYDISAETEVVAPASQMKRVHALVTCHLSDKTNKGVSSIHKQLMQFLYRQFIVMPCIGRHQPRLHMPIYTTVLHHSTQNTGTEN